MCCIYCACKVVIFNYFVLALIPCQIWLYFYSITCTLYFMWDFIVWVVCKRECEHLSTYRRQSGFHEKIREKISCEVSHVQSTRLECEELWQLVFGSNSLVRPSSKIPRNIMFCYFGISAPLCLHPHYIYYHYPHIVRSAFQRKNSSHNPWELEIIIPTILYTIHCDFPQLLSLHMQILERLIAQTLTTPILSVKWGFDATGKYWKKPFVWWMQLSWIAWSRELEKTRLHQVSW